MVHKALVTRLVLGLVTPRGLVSVGLTLLLATGTLGAAAVQPTGGAPPGLTGSDGGRRCDVAATASAGLQDLFTTVLSTPTITNAVMLVQAPTEGLYWVRAGGLADPSSGERMTTRHQFRIASIAKTMTAVVVLQLMEEGALTLDSTLGQLLNAGDLPAGYDVDDLSVVGGRRLGRAITIRQLLNHTAGLRDLVFDSPTATGFAPDSLAATIINDALSDWLGLPSTGIRFTQWSPESLVAAYLSTGLGANALTPPGEAYHYSDSGYHLLGLIIQKLTRSDLATQYRQRLFTPLGMSRSYLEWFEPRRGAGPAHHFLDVTPFGVPIDLDVVATRVNTSFDWAGGGVVSTATDLNRFLRALFEGRLFRHRSTLATMLRGVPTGPDARYGLGVDETRLGETWFLGHTGTWGADAVYAERDGMSIVVTLDQWIFGADPVAVRNAAAQVVDAARQACGATR